LDRDVTLLMIHPDYAVLMNVGSSVISHYQYCNAACYVAVQPW